MSVVSIGMDDSILRERRRTYSQDAIIETLKRHALTDDYGRPVIHRQAAAEVLIHDLDMPASTAYAKLRELRAKGYLVDRSHGYYEIVIQ